MDITTYSYRYATAVLGDKAFQTAFAQLETVIRAATPALYSVDKVKVRQRGNTPVRIFPVDQKALNRSIEDAMPAGWLIRPLVVDPVRVSARGGGPETNIRSDFKKDRIQVEVQFGNMARWYTDVFKFQLAYSLDDIDVGVLIVPTHRFANLIDENVASYERVLRELPWAKMSLTLPILVMGVEPSNYAPLQQLYDAAGAAYLAREGNGGKSLRPFADALVAAEPDSEEGATT